MSSLCAVQVVRGLWLTEQSNEDVLKQYYVVNEMWRYLTNRPSQRKILNREKIMKVKHEESLMEYIW